MEYNYDPEADILAIKLRNRPFDYAEEMGDFIIHFDKNNKPVYIEILHANKFLKKATMSLSKSSKKDIINYVRTS